MGRHVSPRVRRTPWIAGATALALGTLGLSVVTGMAQAGVVGPDSVFVPQSVAECDTTRVYPGFERVATAFVSAEGVGTATPVVSIPVTPGATYKVEAAGTYFAGGVSDFDIQADAEYSQDAHQRANTLPWTDSVRTYESYGEGLLELKVDGAVVEWGDFAADHVYTLDKVASASAMDFQFQVDDIYAQNNTGGLCVALFLGQPDIEITKSVDADYVVVGETIPYTYEVENTGGVDLQSVVVTDNTCSPVAYESGNTGDPDVLSTGETWMFSCDKTATLAQASTKLINTGTVTAATATGVPVTDTDSFTLQALALRKIVAIYWDYIDYVPDPAAGDVHFTVDLKKGGIKVGEEEVSKNAPLYVWLTPGSWQLVEQAPPTGYRIFRGSWNVGTVPSTAYLDNTFFNGSDFNLAISKSGWTYSCTMTTTQADWAAQFPAGDMTNTATVIDAEAGVLAAPYGLFGGDTCLTNNTDTYSLYPFVLRKDVRLYNDGGDIAFDDPDTSFQVKASTTGYYRVMTVSENQPLYLWLADGTWTFRETSYPKGYYPKEDYYVTGFTHVTGQFPPDYYPDWTIVNVTWSGCSHGYWKTHPEAWPTGYTPATLIGSVFLDSGYYDSATFAAALAFTGGSGVRGAEQILLRQAVAALLNEAAYGPAFGPYTGVSALTTAVNSALASGNRTTMLNLAKTLDYWNNGFCR